MKKNRFNWMLASALMGGLMLTACGEIDNSVGPTGPAEPVDPYERTTTVIDFEDDVTPFVGQSRITVGVGTLADWDSKVATFVGAGNSQNGYSFANYNFSDKVSGAAIVTVSFDYYNCNSRAIVTIGDAAIRLNDGGSSKVTYNSTGGIFRIGSDKSNFFVNGNTLGGVEDWTGKWLNVKVVVNNFDRTVEWTVKEGEEIVAQSGTTTEPTEEGGEAVFTPGTVDFYAANAVECTQIDVFGYINNGTNCYIDNLSIESAIDPRIKFADYTVRYVDAAGNELQEAAVRNARVGTNVELLESDKASLYNADKTAKYIYESDNAETTTIAESGTEIIVKFRDAEIWNGVLNCMIEGTSGVANRLDQVTGITFFEGDNYYLYPARGYKHTDGAYYFTAATSSWNGATFTLPGSVQSVTQGGKKYYIGTLYYSKVDSVAYYSDFERLALPTVDEGNGTGLGQLVGTVNSWYSFSGGYFDRFSGARGIRLDAGSYVYTEPIAEAGTYKVTIYGRNDVSAGDPNPYQLGLRAPDGNVTMLNLPIAEWGSATTGANIVEAVGVPAGYSVVIKNPNSAESTSQISLDDISMTKTGDYVASPVAE